MNNYIQVSNSAASNVSSFVAQLVRASHQNRKITGSDPVEVLIFFSGFFNEIEIGYISPQITSLNFISAVHTRMILFTYTLFQNEHYSIKTKINSNLSYFIESLL